MPGDLALLPQPPFVVVTIAGIRWRGTVGPFRRDLDGYEWAHGEGLPLTSCFAAPVLSPAAWKERYA